MRLQHKTCKVEVNTVKYTAISGPGEHIVWFMLTRRVIVSAWRPTKTFLNEAIE